MEIEYTKAVENASEKYQHFVSSVSIFSAHETLHECPKSITRITWINININPPVKPIYIHILAKSPGFGR